MIAGLGVDLVRIERIAAARTRHGARFLNRVYTEAEIGDCLGRKDPDQGLAVRFAAKEAAMKALSTGWASGVGWRDFEVGKTQSGAPTLTLSGRAGEIAVEKGVSNVLVSLSHDGVYAVATVVLEAEGRHR